MSRIRIDLTYPMFIFFFCLNIFFVIANSDNFLKWDNVPPPPKKIYSSFMALGDTQLAYRATGVMLQNIGNMGGRSVNINEYDFHSLKDWFMIADYLDPISDYVPYLASYYFGSTVSPSNASKVVDYLEIAGSRVIAEKWRWMFQAVYLAEYIEKNPERAYELAKNLAVIDYEDPDYPEWLKVFYISTLGDFEQKDFAYALLADMLANKADEMSEAELNRTIEVLCNRLLTPEESRQDVLCRKYIHQ